MALLAWWIKDVDLTILIKRVIKNSVHWWYSLALNGSACMASPTLASTLFVCVCVLYVCRTLAEGLAYSAMSRATGVGPLRGMTQVLRQAGMSQTQVGGGGGDGGGRRGEGGGKAARHKGGLRGMTQVLRQAGMTQTQVWGGGGGGGEGGGGEGRRRVGRPGQEEKGWTGFHGESWAQGDSGVARGEGVCQCMFIHNNWMPVQAAASPIGNQSPIRARLPPQSHSKSEVDI